MIAPSEMKLKRRLTTNPFKRKMKKKLGLSLILSQNQMLKTILIKTVLTVAPIFSK